jgi:alkylated DNA repair dioxygenase AlkB
MAQASLFDLPEPLPANMPEGLVYEPEFLTPDEEAELIERVRGLPLVEAKYKAYTARRRVASYGGRFDYEANRLRPTTELVESLHPLRDRVARWAGLAPESLAHTLVAEYRPGTPLGWHRDVPDFEQVIGISLGSAAVMRFRPYPHEANQRSGVVRLTLAPRSIYRLSGPARWAWQHSLPPVQQLRWSITLRTLAAGRRRGIPLAAKA